MISRELAKENLYWKVIQLILLLGCLLWMRSLGSFTSAFQVLGFSYSTDVQHVGHFANAMAGLIDQTRGVLGVLFLLFLCHIIMQSLDLLVVVLLLGIILLCLFALLLFVTSFLLFLLVNISYLIPIYKTVKRVSVSGCSI